MAYRILATSIPDVRIVVPARIRDARGFLSEVYNRRALEEAGISLVSVQENHSLSHHRGTVRGLHFQLPPHPQEKLVRVVRGAVFDVAVDLRRASPTFGDHVAVVLSAGEGNQLFIPAGFAHGFCTLEPGTEVAYLLSDHYAPACEAGVAWDDPRLAIPWPVSPHEAILSERDRSLPRLAELEGLLP